jgi:hypothetical protein
MWLNLAVYNGAGSAAKKLLTDIAKQMNTSQIGEAHKLAKECFTNNYNKCDL